jgi:hypothetical protein
MTESAVKFPRHTKGKRPQVFDSPDIDQMMTFVIELTTEVSVLTDRLNTVEQLLDTHGTISRQDIENYIPDPQIEAQRVESRKGLIKRVFRMHGDQ